MLAGPLLLLAAAGSVVSRRSRLTRGTPATDQCGAECLAAEHLRACERRRDAAVLQIRRILAAYDSLPDAEKARARPFVARSPLLVDAIPASELEGEYRDLRMSALYRKTGIQWALQALARGELREGNELCDPQDPLRAFPPGAAPWLAQTLSLGYVDVPTASATLGASNSKFLDRSGAAPWDSFDTGRTSGGAALRVLSLQYAARIGDDALQEFLVRRGVDVAARDATGRSALHFLAGRGAEPTAALRSAVDALPEADRAALLAAVDSRGRTSAAVAAARSRELRQVPAGAPLQGNGGWEGSVDAPLLPDPEAADAWQRLVDGSVCDVDAVQWGADVGTAEFLHDYAALTRPVLMRGVLSESDPLRAFLRRDALVGDFGHVNLSVGSIPYPDAYAGGRLTRRSVRDFVASAERGEYAFDGLDGTDPARAFADALRKLVPPPLRRGRDPDAEGMSLQFWLGQRGTGSPFHSHHDAVNVVVYGAKLWLLYPPESGVFSTRPVSQWMAETWRTRGAPRPGLTQPLLCMQRAGEALYVPYGWSHATLNTEYSVGFAGEQVELERVWPELWPFEPVRSKGG
eukprot:TRINITY_DN28719_c0_g1_i1.p1 TRINITY_DN28719_c0_g1~~TRINITY_DN28719_c0_g1_i1.p1  ORF type:complete len:577 (+),score=188.09 TRINITY_DN28719_c0_g1_i1:45-1775(+)